MDTAGLINGMAQILNFREADWKWFASRYNMPLVDRNAELRKKSWYDHKPEEVLPWLQPPAEGEGTAAVPEIEGEMAGCEEGEPLFLPEEPEEEESSGSVEAPEPPEGITEPEPPVK